MSTNSTVAVNFAYADATTRSFEMGPFAVEAVSATDFKNRLRTFNSVDETEHKKFTNFAEVMKSENGSALTGIKSATITVSQVTRIYDATTYQP